MPVAGRNWTSIFTGLAEAALLLTALFSVATAFDEWHRYLELFSHFRFQYFVIGLALTLAFMYMRWTRYVVIGVATTMLNGWLVVPWFLPITNPEPAIEDVTILHANVHVSNTDSTRFIKLVQDRNPDLIVLQEATSGWMASLDEIRSSYPYRLIETREDPYGIALLSKFPLESTAVIESVPLGYPEVIATAIVGGTRLNIISTHPMIPIGVTNHGARNLQLDAVAQLASRTPDPVILIGDLNVSMWAISYRRMENRSGLRNARAGFGVEPTWPVFLPFAMIPIDHCLVSDGIVVTDFHAESYIGSDHLPILVSIRFEQ